MNNVLKVIVGIYVVLFLVISFVSWDITWVADCPTGGRFAYFMGGAILSLAGIIAVEEN